MLPNYFTLERARELLAELSLPRLNAMSDEALVNACAIASLRIDADGPWRDRKANADQAMEFPRTGQTAVPIQVELAVLHEAEWLNDPTRKRAAAAITAGITAQSTGGLSVSYAQPVADSINTVQLCETARLLLSNFRRRLTETV